MSDHETRFVSDEEFALAVQRVGGLPAVFLAEIDEHICPHVDSPLYEAWVEARRAWNSYAMWGQQLYDELDQLLPRDATAQSESPPETWGWTPARGHVLAREIALKY